MARILKYIVVEIYRQEEIVIFSVSVNHDAMAATVKHPVVAAGFVDMDTGECFGESIKLKIKSRGLKDQRLIIYKEARY